MTKRTKGPQQVNKPRKLAMYLCQELIGVKLNDIVTQIYLLRLRGRVMIPTVKTGPKV